MSSSEASLLADHVRDALWKVDSADVAPFDAPGGLVLAGAGVAAVAARLAVQAVAGTSNRPVVVLDGDELPRWVDSRWAVLCTSYAGDDPATVAVFDAAGEHGARRLVATSGGELAARAREAGVPVIPFAGGFDDPSDAIAYQLVAALAAAELCGAAADIRRQLDAAADALASVVSEWGDGGRPKELAERLAGRTPVLLHDERSAAIASFWRLVLSRAGTWPALGTVAEVHGGMPVPGIVVALGARAEDVPGDWLDGRGGEDGLAGLLVQVALGGLVAAHLASARPSRETQEPSYRASVARVDKPWGHEILWAVTDQYVGKILFVKAGCSLSLQYHERKDESWLVQEGRARLEIGQVGDEALETIEIATGDAFRYRPGTVHRITAVEDTTILEASTAHLDDIVRLEDSYGRAG